MHPIQLKDFPAIKQLRHDLHRHPELSGQEKNTAARIAAFLQAYQPDELLCGLGGTGVAAVFHGNVSEGPVVLFRAELDALPIAETGKVIHKSEQEEVGHMCGHDGHMATLTALGSLLHQQKLQRGKVILLYQPAEETGAGAWGVLQDERFRQQLKPDFVFALHNLPGVPLHQVVVRQEVFAAASAGMIVELYGKSSHAAEPENGLNPGLAMADLITAFTGITQKEQFQDLALLTVIYACLGEVSFGTNPGFATVMATLRSYLPADLQMLKRLAQQAAAKVATEYQLQHEVRFLEEFPATINNPEAVQLVQRAAQNLSLEIQEAAQPFRWSEDFGHFTHQYRGALFGLGSGLSQPQLHHTDFDYPDELIPTGAALFYRIAADLLND